MNTVPIGVFDSGIGGLTVLKEIVKELPQYDYVYLGDNARAPYGSRSIETVYRYTWECVQKLFEKNCRLVILACNTSSSKALKNIQQLDLPQLHPKRNVLGIIIPTSEVVGNYTKTRQVGILGTTGTVLSNSYKMEIHKNFPDIKVFQQACPIWVPLVESGEMNSYAADILVKQHLQQLLGQSKKIDTIILGCTHYPLLLKKIKKYVAKNVRILSQGSIVAKSLADYLERHSEYKNNLTRVKPLSFIQQNRPKVLTNWQELSSERKLNRSLLSCNNNFVPMSLKKAYSFIACCIVCVVFLTYRLWYSGLNPNHTLRNTTWDAFGYYMYLPSAIIYNDATKLKWLPEMDNKYHLTGGWVYQANIYHKNGKYVFKYLGGVAILELPFFLIGHVIAKVFHFDADGFSPPYQYALAFGVLWYCVLALFLLRRILLKYFSDETTALVILLLMLATNIMQYIALDSVQSHGFIFPLYVLILYFTIKWHEQPKIIWACLIGYTIGLATISRPTEAIMLFIPLFWNTHTKEAAKAKWILVKQYKNHIYWVIGFTFLGVLPQLIYWQIATGFFVYDVGSKWTFLNPFFRVLFGWEKGWFIYTPVTVFFIVGMFYMKNYPFKKSVLWFCLLNIWIIISWFDWRYGGSYSTRALSQSYPVFALPFAAFIERFSVKKWKYLFYVVGIYLVGVNLFQIGQVNQQILHGDWMNRKYYGHIYLNPHPTPLDMSLIDTCDFLDNEKVYQSIVVLQIDSARLLHIPANGTEPIIQMEIKPDSASNHITEKWVKIEVEIKARKGLWGSFLNSDYRYVDLVKTNRVRLFSPISVEGDLNKYAYYIKMLGLKDTGKLKLYITTTSDFEGEIQNINITTFEK